MNRNKSLPGCLVISYRINSEATSIAIITEKLYSLEHRMVRCGFSRWVNTIDRIHILPRSLSRLDFDIEEHLVVRIHLFIFNRQNR